MDYIDVEAIKGKYTAKTGFPQTLRRRERLQLTFAFVVMLAVMFISIIRGEGEGNGPSLPFIIQLAIVVIVLSGAAYGQRRYELQKDKAFIEQLNQCIRAYNDTRDAQAYFQQLMSIEAPAQDAYSISFWRLETARALMFMERLPEAAALLEDLDGLVGQEREKQLLASLRAQLHAQAVTARDRGVD